MRDYTVQRHSSPCSGCARVHVTQSRRMRPFISAFSWAQVLIHPQGDAEQLAFAQDFVSCHCHFVGRVSGSGILCAPSELGVPKRH